MTRWLRRFFARTPDGACPACWSKQWRAAILNTYPARVCGKCTLVETLTTEAFYAQFGIMPHRWGYVSQKGTPDGN